MSPQTPPPSYQLTPEEIQALQDIDSVIARAKDGIARFKRAGFDASALERNLNAAVARRAGLLKHFGSVAGNI